MNNTESASFAYIGDDQQVKMSPTIGHDVKSLSHSYGPSGESIACLWPLWSPNNRWIAYFQLGSIELPPSICITEVNGIEQRVLAYETEGMPIYAAWSPDSHQLAVLFQLDELQLYVYHIDQLGEGKLIAEGAPLFFRWLEDSTGLLVHSIHKRAGNSTLINTSLLPYGEDSSLSQRPGGFSVPLLINDHTVFAEKSQNKTYIYQSGLNGDDKTLLFDVVGVVSMQRHPSKPLIAYASAPSSDGTPFVGLSIFNIMGRSHQLVFKDELSSFYWSPCGERLLLVRVDREKRCMHLEMWSESEGLTYVHPFWPTREQIFHIHFFEQFDLSHKQFSECGKYFVYSGFRKKDIDEGISLEPYVFLTDLNTLQTRAVCKGLFATFPQIERPCDNG